MIHKIKTIQPFFSHVEMGLKRFEVRKNDRNYRVGDILVLQEWNLENYTGKKVKAIITYILDDANYCKDGYVIIGFVKL